MCTYLCPIRAQQKITWMWVLDRPFVAAKENKMKKKLSKETGNKIPLIFSFSQTVFFTFIYYYYYHFFQYFANAMPPRKTFLNYSRPACRILPSGLIFYFYWIFFVCHRVPIIQEHTTTYHNNITICTIDRRPPPLLDCPVNQYLCVVVYIILP